MYSKFKVFLLTGFFLLIATAVFAEPFWVFKTGHTIKYTRAKSDGTSWIVTMTIGAGGQNVCGRNDYYKLDEYNYDNKGETSTKYLRVTESEGWQCDTGSGIEYKFFEAGKPEGYGWTYPESIGQDDDGTRINIVSVSRFGAQITMRRWSREGGINKPAVYNTFVRGFGLIKETDQWVEDNVPWTQVRHGYRGKTLYANFPGSGLYTYDYDGTGKWARINTTANSMVASGPNLYATFEGYGLYLWDGTVWTKINSAIPAKMVVMGWSLYATFTGYDGLYKFNQDGTWTRINTTPDSMVVSGSNLYAIFSGYGLYKYDGTAWTRINGAIPSSMVQGIN